MVYKIADLYIEIKSIYDSVHTLCKKYICENPPRVDISVETTEKDIDFEERESFEMYKTAVSDRAGYEELAVYRKICSAVLEYNAFLMHCAVIEYKGNGYAFLAKSGTGKTTHIRLWKKVFGKENVTVVNGDKPLLRAVDGELYAYGTPWCGKEGYNVNTRVPLRGICFVERSKTNEITRISDEDAVPRLFSQIMITDSGNLAKQLELCDIMLEKVPVYLLKCNMDESAANVAYDGMKNADKGE